MKCQSRLIRQPWVGAEIRGGFHFILDVIEPHHALMVICREMPLRRPMG